MGTFHSSLSRKFTKMKVVLVLLAIIALGISISLPDDAEIKFQDWMRQYNKVYASDDDYQSRFLAFKANLARIDYYNAHDDGTAFYTITEFADMSQEEFSALYLGLKPRGLYHAEKADLLDTSSTPSSVDWRKEGAVTGVKNQQQCGSCWSFSTTGNIEGQWKLAGHDLVSLSEQQLVDCDKVDQGCNGGEMADGFRYSIKNGNMLESEYPYKARDGTCHYDSSKVVARISSWEQVSDDETQMAAYCAKNGPLSIGINAGPMQLYGGGIANPRFCNPNALDHGVLIVGYGEESGTDYWIIKNSWGKSWGEEGYYRIVRGTGKCGLNTDVTCSKV